MRSSLTVARLCWFATLKLGHAAQQTGLQVNQHSITVNGGPIHRRLNFSRDAEGGPVGAGVKQSAPESRKAAGDACTHALRALTRGNCLTRASNASGGSFSARRQTWAMQGIRAKPGRGLRPPQLARPWHCRAEQRA